MKKYQKVVLKVLKKNIFEKKFKKSHDKNINSKDENKDIIDIDISEIKYDKKKKINLIRIPQD